MRFRSEGSSESKFLSGVSGREVQNRFPPGESETRRRDRSGMKAISVRRKSLD
jgi:hypothetical protein